MTDRLAIYRLGKQDTSSKRLATLGQQLFGLRDFKLSGTRDGAALRNGELVVELAHASGAIWAADESQLWKPSIKAELLHKDDALLRAEEFLKRNRLLPDLRAPFTYGQPVLGGTHFALQQDGRRDNRRLDMQLIYPVLVGGLPVIGGGSDLTITLGDKGRIIGFNGGWRPVTGAFDAKLIDSKKATERLRELMSRMKIESFETSLAYYTPRPRSEPTPILWTPICPTGGRYGEVLHEQDHAKWCG